ncbi:IS5 family transposase [Ottowia sp.]|uniref:IS5 family transposase n=1 Tax=Ottowia sp. TaxID=1898956 RepID=UPI002C1DF9DC|nr:IS5 family transposase [Ottowia sp.]HOB65787.1 IS5 family transposase [Ottowia sp.]HPZ57667.1 IS5 family transposase [Ottowia sp.]HQD47093.1 IS5 family transposase [Ottowia sp.]
MAKTGRPPSIHPRRYEALRKLVQAHPQATLPELAQAWAEWTGCDAPSTVTLAKTLRLAGLQRQRPPQRTPARAVRQRYGYTERHRAGPAHGALTDAEWALASDLFEQPAGARGRPAVHDRRAMVEACCYILRTGASWRSLPAGIYPPWPSVQKAFVLWARDGRFDQLQQRLRQQWRVRIERAAQPSEAVIDSQSTRGSAQGGALDFDAGKKVKGRKRHLVVDTLGLLLAVVITSAAVPDRAAAAQAVRQTCARTSHSITTLWADSAYAGQCAQDIEQRTQVRVNIVRASTRARWDDAQHSLWPEQVPVTMPARRWVVERTHAWLERHRRLVMHHERKPIYASAWVWLAQARMLLRRLA